MIDYNKEVVSALKTVLPTHYELTLTSKTQTPCISYMEFNNVSVTDVVGATVGYSNIYFQVKVWSTKVADINKYAKEIDRVMRGLGFKRTSSNELQDRNSTMIQRVMMYEALAVEQF